ncbi:MAG: LapA family protein [Alphaproteobacteria bacterium]|nr:LapA family protein [Alphaproteobacteria bacterium]
MRIFPGIFGLLFLVLILVFALPNKGEVTVALPLMGSVQAPLYAIGLLPLIFGFSFGLLLGWLSALPHKRHAKKLVKELGSLNDKIGELQKTATVQHAKVKVLKPPFWRR